MSSIDEISGESRKTMKGGLKLNNEKLSIILIKEKRALSPNFFYPNKLIFARMLLKIYVLLLSSYGFLKISNFERKFISI